MKFNKTIDNPAMRLAGKVIDASHSKFHGIGYNLHVGAACVPLCCLAKKELGVDLADGEEIRITKITFEFDTEKKVLGL